MRTELHHILNPQRTNIAWTLFYVAIGAALVAGFLLVANRIRTYSVPAGSVQLSIPYKTYLVGEPITFTLVNNYNGTIYVDNECPNEPLAVYRKEKSKWVRIHAETTDDKCHESDRQIRVAAGGQQSGSYANWPDLFKEPGQYRVVAYVEYFDIAPYQDFEVIEKPRAATENSSPASTLTPKSNTATTQSSTSSSTSSTTPSATASTSTSLPAKTVTTSSGTVRVTYSTSTIYVQSISPAGGCTYEGGRSGGQVEVTFKCGGTETQVQLWLSGGQIQTKIENDD